MFPYLWAQAIGLGFSLFYMAWASVLETNRRFQDVDDVYKMGIARKAKPLPKLQQEYQRFQRRMVDRVKRDLVARDGTESGHNNSDF